MAFVLTSCATSSPPAVVTPGAAINQDLALNLKILGPCDIKPKFVSGIGPTYSFLRRLRKENGQVVVSFTIDAQGRPKDIRVVSASFTEMGSDVTRAVETWRFVPAKTNGVPVAVPVRQTFNFVLRGTAKPPDNREPKTPIERYVKEVNERIGQKWFSSIEQRVNDPSLGIGIVVLQFDVTLGGHIQNIKIVSNSGNEILAKLTVETLKGVVLLPFPWLFGASCETAYYRRPNIRSPFIDRREDLDNGEREIESADTSRSSAGPGNFVRLRAFQGVGRLK